MTQSEEQEIKEIRAVKDRPSRRKVVVGKRAVAELGEDDIERLKLRPGLKWTESLARKVEAAAAQERAQREAMRMIAKRARSSEEIRRVLERKGFACAVIEHACAALVRGGWLNDAVFARALAEETVGRKPAGRRLVEARLSKRGVDQPGMQRAAAEALRGTTEREGAMKLAKMLMKQKAGLRPEARARRVAAGLARRGFEEEVVMEVLEDLGLTGERG